MSTMNPTRRDVLAAMAGAGIAGALPATAFAQAGMPLRRIPGRIIGLGFRRERVRSPAA